MSRCARSGNLRMEPLTIIEFLVIMMNRPYSYLIISVQTQVNTWFIHHNYSIRQTCNPLIIPGRHVSDDQLDSAGHTHFRKIITIPPDIRISVRLEPFHQYDGSAGTVSFVLFHFNPTECMIITCIERSVLCACWPHKTNVCVCVLAAILWMTIVARTMSPSQQQSVYSKRIHI